jgi:hypothetical protein
MINKRAPAANGGPQLKRVARLYAPALIGLTAADLINPRRMRNVEQLVSYHEWHGGKLYLTRARYSELRERGMDRLRVDQAVNDAYTLGNLDLREAGGCLVIELIGAIVAGEVRR